MSKKLHGFIAIWLIVATILLALPKAALADGGEGASEQEVNGYHIALSFVEKAKVGENQFHIQIKDSMGMPVANAEVEVSAMPAEGMEMETEAPSVGVMTSNNSMDSMEMATEAPATGVMKPNAPAADGHGEENVTVMLEPTTESGEYAGEVHIEKSGEWMLSVHFSVNGETTEVDFPINVTRALSTNYAVLGGFFGINVTALAAAAVLKRKSPVIRK